MPRNPSWRRYAAPLLFAACLASKAEAASVTTSFTVTLRVVGSCSVSAGTLDFGSVLAGTPPSGLRAQASIDVSCTAGTPFCISLTPASTGQSNGHGVLTGPAGQDGVAYRLYRDGVLHQPWGGNAGAVSGTGGGKTRLTVYGWIPPGQHVQANSGTYADHVLVTVTY